LGARASIAYLPKARVLARLNTLYGMRLAAKGETQKAVDTWIAGVRFSQHLARGGTLIFSISASHALIADLRALAWAAQKGSLNQEQRNRGEACLKALPDTGFDWGEAMWHEASTVQVIIQDFKNASSGAAYYQELLSSPAPANFTIPNDAEVAAFYKFMASVEAALRLAPPQAQDKLKTLQESVRTLHPLFQALMPNLLRINSVRTQVQSSRQTLLQALSAT
jgi:hypothetical protein